MDAARRENESRPARIRVPCSVTKKGFAPVEYRTVSRLKPRKSAPPGLDDLRSGYALAPAVQPWRTLILIVAR